MPKSFLWFLATLGIFLLQLFPIPGIFMMMLAAPFWSVLTVNLGFIGTGWEAATGQVSRAWLLLPLLWFGGYEAAAVLSHWRLHSLDREFARHNRAQAIAFDGSRHSVVIESDDDQLDGAAAWLVRSTSLAVAYSARSDPGEAPFIAYRLGESRTCDRIRDDPMRAVAGIRVRPYFEDGRLVEGLCLYQAPQDPALPVHKVTGTGEDFEDPILPHRLVTIRIEDPAGRTATLKAGRAEPLGWIPLPTIGCMMGSSSWDCFATFYRPGQRGLGGSSGKDRGPLPALAEALGLEPAPASRRRGRIGASSTAELDRIAAVQAEKSLAGFDRALASGDRRLTLHYVAALKERPDLLGPRAEKIAQALAAARADPSAREKANVLGGLLAMLAPADFQRVENRLLRLYEHGPIRPGTPDRDPLLTRLGNLGPRALPMLERQMGFGRHAGASAILGLCRVGPAAAGYADKVAAVLKETRRSGGDSAHSAAFVTLLRMGRPDLADSDPDSASPYRKREYEAVRRSVRPSSPPRVCVDDWGLPRLPDVPAPG